MIKRQRSAIVSDSKIAVTPLAAISLSQEAEGELRGAAFSPLEVELRIATVSHRSVKRL